MLTVAGVQAATVRLAPVADTSLNDQSTAVADGAGPHLWVGQTNGAGNRRALIRFDLSGVPPASIVTGARLTLFLSRTISPDQMISLHPLNASWGEGTSNGGSGGAGAPASANDATWGFRFFGSRTPWGSLGGDFAAPSANLVVGVQSASYQWASPALAADVQRWLNQPSTNFGWIMIGNETQRSAMRFDSRENGITAPYLEVDVTPTPNASVPVPMGWWCIAVVGVLGALLRARKVA